MIDLIKTFDNVWIFFTIFFLPIFSYAEIHFRLGKFTGLLFKKEPEIIFDLPFRSGIGKNVPLFLFIKDAQSYPVTILNLEIHITSEKFQNTNIIKKEMNLEVKQNFFNRSFELQEEFFPTSGFYEISAKLNYQVGNKVKKLQQDNYRHISHEPFKIYISNDPLPSLDGWHWGDLHLHSNFTEDKVEFGAPIEETVKCAKSIGLKFIAVTDHSFDFENTSSNSDFTLKKWRDFIRQIDSTEKQVADFVVLPGEEVSTGNHENQNIHCLLLGNREFYRGVGDGAKTIMNNRPTLSLIDLQTGVHERDSQAIIAAAHPGDIPPLSQKLILNRGGWGKKDLLTDQLDFWQILNGKLDKFFLYAFGQWKHALLHKYRIGILAGTDAHGNFNCFRQIKTPLIKMVKNYHQLLGLTRSGVFINGQMDSTNLLDALRKKRVVISNGPIIEIEIQQNEQTFFIGDEFTTNHPFTLKLQAKSSKEFGEIKKIYLYNGSYQDKKEFRIPIEVGSNTFSFEEEIDLSQKLKTGYIRSEIYTDNGQWHHFCLTNPIWVQ
jgi:hypothetical protein